MSDRAATAILYSLAAVVFLVAAVLHSMALIWAVNQVGGGLPYSWRGVTAVTVLTWSAASLFSCARGRK